MKTRLQILILLMALAGCTPKPITIDIEEQEPRLVIASQVIPDRFMIIVVTKSFGALQSDPNSDTVSSDILSNLVVEHARVTVTYRGQTDTLVHLSEAVRNYVSTMPYPIDLSILDLNDSIFFARCIYVSTEVLRNAYENYTLNVYDSLTGLTVSSVASMMQFIPFDSIYPYKNTPSDTTVKLHYSFIDPPGDNYYMLNYYIRKSDPDYSGLPYNTSAVVSNYTGHPVILITELISDKLFKDPYVSNDIDLPDASVNDSLAVTISNISESYYNYLTARKRSGTLFTQIVNEPINYPSNVVNGYGFFNTQFPDIRLFSLMDMKRAE